MREKTMQQAFNDLQVACETLIVSTYVDIRRKLNALKKAFKIGGGK